MLNKILIFLRLKAKTKPVPPIDSLEFKELCQKTIDNNTYRLLNNNKIMGKKYVKYSEIIFKYLFLILFLLASFWFLIVIYK